jgi:hypothetical protein
MGHKLYVGDWVSILPPPNTIWIGKIADVSDGGLSLSIDRNNKGVTPAKVRVVLDISLNANPQMPIFPNLVKVPPPGSDDMIDKVIEEVEKQPPPSGPITM